MPESMTPRVFAAHQAQYEFKKEARGAGIKTLEF